MREGWQLEVVRMVLGGGFLLGFVSAFALTFSDVFWATPEYIAEDAGTSMGVGLSMSVTVLIFMAAGGAFSER